MFSWLDLLKHFHRPPFYTHTLSIFKQTATFTTRCNIRVRSTTHDWLRAIELFMVQTPRNTTHTYIETNGKFSDLVDSRDT